ncbi:triose-phosphate isomerase [Bartonella sp. DGB2]|uniref:triose-phosphate isomerase n=1 Tax=Bartonella sp. DGB2 TaxID=3388426 RepID=UPI00399035D9
MTPSIRPLVAGNWKMNGTRNALGELRAIAAGIHSDLAYLLDALICVPATLLYAAREALDGEKLLLGGQDCHSFASGSYTGDISAAMLKDVGAHYVILGHSERRQAYHESNELIGRKMQAAWKAGLCVILCVGESLAEREAGKTLTLIAKQLDDSIAQAQQEKNTENMTPHNLIIAYEPLWAIGTGQAANLGAVSEVHDFMRIYLEQRYGTIARTIRLLYGGSVKSDNALGLLGLSNVDGALVGGASLLAEDFLAICDVYRKITHKIIP